MARTTAYGPRRLVKRNLQKIQKQNQVHVPIVGQPAVVNESQVQPGNINLYSYATPGLKTGDTYTASFTQTINYSGATDQILVSNKQFSTVPAPYTLDSSLINSVYPPSGHSDYWNVLPHVLFNNAQTPWLLQGTNEDASTNPTPWIALLVFTENELTPDLPTLGSIGTATGAIPQRSPTLSYNLQVKDLYALNSTVSQPVPSSSSNDTTQIQAVFMPGSLFATLFGTPTSSTNASVDPETTTPSLGRFKYMSHVRRFNASGVTNQNPLNIQELAATVSPRTGDSSITTPTVAYAHLVSLAGIADNAGLTLDQTKPAALVSLYSWTFNHLPSTYFDTKQVLVDLASTLQPLSAPYPTLASVKTQVSNETAADTWVKTKMLAGYSLVRYRTLTGELAIAITRGFLTGVKFDTLDLPPSNYGSDLALVDESSGFLDLTWQLAWELGRTLAVGDRVFASSMMRLRQAIHTQNLEAAKGEVDSLWMPAPMTLGRWTNSQQSISMRLSQNTNFIGYRWQGSSLGTSTWESLSFQTNEVLGQYRTQLQSGTGAFAGAVGETTGVEYDETNTPESSDYANVLSWIMDKWFLGSIPYTNLIPDPSFLPKESARSFYVDQNWFKVFVDGALSIAEHYDEGDDVREAIKASLTEYLTTNVTGTTYPPQIPKWGLFIRSEFITRYPDMRISAPFKDAGMTDTQTDILRAETLDTDLLMLLFDREPSDFSSSGITFTPPEHQLSSMFGEAAGLNPAGALNVNFKVISVVGSTPAQTGVASLNIILNDPTNGVYDSSCRSLVPQNFATVAATQTGLSTDHANAQMVGAELVAMVPTMQFVPGADPSVQASSAVHSSILSTKSKLHQFIPPAVKPTITRPLALTVTPLDANPPTLPTYAAPTNAMVKAIAKLNIYDIADSDIVSNFFTLAAPRQGPLTTTTLQHNTPVGDNSAPSLSTTFFNLHYPDQNQLGLRTSSPYQSALAGLFPTSLSFKTDIHISNISVATSPILCSSVQIFIPVDSDPKSAFLAPFPTNTASTAPITRNASGEWPLQPNSTGPKYSGVVLPVVRFTGIGRRWIPTTSYANGVFTITLTPNKATPQNSPYTPAYWDISTYKDMSLVIENVQLNVQAAAPWQPPPANYQGPPLYFYPGPGLSSNTFQVQVIETYWDAHAGGEYTYSGAANVTIYGVNVTGSLITATG